MLPFFPCAIGSRDSAPGIECCGAVRGGESPGKWIISHFCPFCFESKHMLETKMMFRWERKGKMKWLQDMKGKYTSMET